MYEVIEETKNVPTKSISIKAVITKCPRTDFYILLAFLLIAIALLMAASIYCFCIKYQTKQNLYFFATTQLKETKY